MDREKQQSGGKVSQGHRAVQGKAEKPPLANPSHSSPEKGQAQHTGTDRDDGQHRIHLVPSKLDCCLDVDDCHVKVPLTHTIAIAKIDDDWIQTYSPNRRKPVILDKGV